MSRMERVLWVAGALLAASPWIFGGNPKGALLFLLLTLVPFLFYVFVVTPNVVRPMGVIFVGIHLWLWVVIVRSEYPAENRAFAPLTAWFLDSVVVLVLGPLGAAVYHRSERRREGATESGS